eukprot:1045735-Prymnesium_polylepis.1
MRVIALRGAATRLCGNLRQNDTFLQISPTLGSGQRHVTTRPDRIRWSYGTTSGGAALRGGEREGHGEEWFGKRAEESIPRAHTKYDRTRNNHSAQSLLYSTCPPHTWPNGCTY